MAIPPPVKIPFLKKSLAPLWDYLRRNHITWGPGLLMTSTAGAGMFVDTATPLNKPDSDKLDFTIYFADGTEKIITHEETVAERDPEEDQDWSAEFQISASGGMNGIVTYSSETERFPDDGESPPVQTFYRLPIIRVGEEVSSGGIYDEIKLCPDGTPQTQLIKSG